MTGRVGLADEDVLVGAFVERIGRTYQGAVGGAGVDRDFPGCAVFEAGNIDLAIARHAIGVAAAGVSVQRQNRSGGRGSIERHIDRGDRGFVAGGVELLDLNGIRIICGEQKSATLAVRPGCTVVERILPIIGVKTDVDDVVAGDAITIAGTGVLLERQNRGRRRGDRVYREIEPFGGRGRVAGSIHLADHDAVFAFRGE